jgi:LemA protein
MARRSSSANLNGGAQRAYMTDRLRRRPRWERFPDRLAAGTFCGYLLAAAAKRSASMSVSTIIVLAVIVVAVLWAISVYNGLVTMRQRVNEAFADVDVQLRQRHDLVPNLVETVKGYAAHERGTLDEVVKARNAAVAAQGAPPAQQAAAENMLSGALRQLFALSEAYPNLKANTEFQQLQTELADLENKIAAARRFFNNAVQEYNTGIQRFPAALFASSFGFAPKDFFDLGTDRQAELQAPQVKF